MEPHPLFVSYIKACVEYSKQNLKNMVTEVLVEEAKTRKLMIGKG